MTILDALPETQPDTAASDAVVERLFGAVLATMDPHAVYLGDRLGYCRALAAGPLTSSELAAHTGTAERYGPARGRWRGRRGHGRAGGGDVHRPGDDVERLMYGYSLLCCLAGCGEVQRRGSAAGRRGNTPPCRTSRRPSSSSAPAVT